ncbi:MULTISPECIES: helix-turn-helix transcriptional regulator [Rhizobium]|uniref:DNA-binding CsgD family transcriptional regulator n=1 Tax=Rhizobium paranaense TaxID=1650438 RepID=A0A7W9D4R5_9HYPH|nr:helix-turn-helix transcriptional regulator [Rhizobium paranaense]MBB5577757.1 DNA-binding CsgD family transcriptional regulator [Rhizobium paranaense]PST61720.1 DNA-binding protein [Rhizobium sp. SEMIA4064]
MRFDLHALDRATDGFFGAALDPTLWPVVLEKVSAATGSYGVNIAPIEGRLLNTFIVTESLIPAMENYFAEEWYKQDFRRLNVPIMRRAGVMVEQDFAGEDEFKTLDFYQSQERFGLRWSAIVGFSSGDDLLAFALQRRIKDGPYSREEARNLYRIRQKLMITARIMRDISASEVKGMAAAFEMANVACVFFDRMGHVTTVNEKMRRLLGPDLQITQGQMRPVRKDDANAFDRQLKAILGEENLLTMAEPDILLLSRKGRRPLIVRMQRLDGDMQDIFCHSCAFATIEDPEEKVHQRPATLTKLFGLTRAEAEIALMLAQGMTLHDIAAQRTVSYQTARAHLKSIYRKTDTNRQPELSLLLAGIRMG